MKLLAPNGKPSNLTPEQYRLVRTPAFKKWFGDWENSPETASKVVDENGEPLICYHGTTKYFNEFNYSENATNDFGIEGRGHYFSNEKGIAIQYAKRYIKELKDFDSTNGRVIEVFLKINNPASRKETSVLMSKYKDFETNARETQKELINKGFNGVIKKYPSGDNSYEFIVFESTQIKLADGTNTTFDGNNPDIRFKDGGYIGSCVDVGSGKKEVCKYFPDATIMAQYVGNPDENDWGKSKETTSEEFYKFVSKDDVPKKAIIGEHTYHYISEDSYGRNMNINETAIYFIYNADSDIHYFFKKTKFKNGGLTTIMNLAPNGKPSNLTPEQYRLVRTTAFKKWFGDWENSPETASKVVDKNGEPLVVYHGSNDKITTFNSDYSYYGEFWFSRNKEKILKGESGASGIKYILPCFLNIRKLAGWDEYQKLYTDERIQMGFLGTHLDEDYIAYYPNQIKLADGTNTTFDANNPDIRFGNGGGIEKLAFIQKNENGFYWLYAINDKGDNYKDIDGDKRLYVVKDMAERFGYKLVSAKQFNDFYKIDDRFKMYENRRKFKLGGTTMRKPKNMLLAPNGKPSNLTPEQYRLVRTPAFKKWFGDWEKKPKTASKCIDSNGEPLVVYYGGRTKINVFDNKKSGSLRKGIFTTNDKEVAKHYTGFRTYYGMKSKDIDKNGWKNSISGEYIDKGGIYDLFLNIRKPLIIDVKENDWLSIPNPFKKNSQTLDTDTIVEMAKERKYDGVFFFNIIEEGGFGNDYVALNSNQIKLADGSNTTFDGSNPDIRFGSGGKIMSNPNEQISKIGTEWQNNNQPYLYLKVIGEDEGQFTDDSVSDEERKRYIVLYTDKDQPIPNSKLDYVNKLEYDRTLPIYFKQVINKLIAPNGKPSNLDAEQYKLVRTTEFKAWFGDWENDSENSSKVVDENGEPLVVYHGFKGLMAKEVKDINVFKAGKKYRKMSDNMFLKSYNYPEHINELEWQEEGIFFTDDLLTSVNYAMFRIEFGEEKKYFLNIRNPIVRGNDSDAKSWVYLIPQIFIGGYSESSNDGFIVRGVIENGQSQTTYNVKNPIQIKLADGSNTTFDGSNPDIRFDDGGSVKSKIGWHVSKSKNSDLIEENGLKADKKGRVYLWLDKYYADWFKSFKEDDGEDFDMWEIDISGLKLERDSEAENMYQWSSRFEEGEFGEAYIYLGNIPSSRIIQKLKNGGDIRFNNGGKVKFKIESREGEEDRTEISIKGIGSVTLVETYPKYEFQEDLSEKEFDKLGLDEDDMIGKIEHIEVKDEEKGKGYAKLLMNKVIDVATKKGLFPLYLNASPMGSKGLGIDDLTNFYESFGFKVFKKQGNNNLMLLNKKFDLGGTTMRKPKQKLLAPNGKPSNLTPEQYRLVRKLADGTNKKFDGSNPDIRFSDGGVGIPNNIPEKIKKELLKIQSKKYNCSIYGDCISASEEVAKILIDNGVSDFKVIEGYVLVNEKWTGKNETGNNKIIQHTWIKLKSGNIIDLSISQFDKYGGINKYIDDSNTSRFSAEYPKNIWTANEFLNIIDKKENGGDIISGGTIPDLLSIEQIENKLGRKLNSWKDDLVDIGGQKYKKVYLRPEYKIVTE